MKNLSFLFLFSMMVFFIGCSKDESPVTPNNSNSDIPADPVNLTVPAPVKNNVQPTATITSAEGNPSRILVNLTGLLDPTNNTPITLTFNSSNPGASNVFVTEDGKAKGLKVTKVGSGTTLLADICFLVDNSGSMGQEADSIAAGIVKFANYLQSSGLAVKFSIVGQGYSGGGISGGINFTDATTISNYLSRPGKSGTTRTTGFSGPDSAALANAITNFGVGVSGENLVKAAIYADTFYTWRSGAQRIFIAFTDEPTQPNSRYLNTPYLCSTLSGKATVHTVYSGPSDTSQAYNGWNALNERPWDMSKCTGGTVILLPSDAVGLNLVNLPVSGALSNSYLLEFVGNNNGAQHNVVITVITGSADGKKEYYISY
ncbi:MAG: vWA domain-containing protein [Ignavibacteriaceae bacterium]